MNPTDANGGSETTPSTPAPGDGPRDAPPELPPLPTGLYCPQCDYDLRSLTSERCPECGDSLIGVREGKSLIAWARRRDIGRLRAYWLTVGMATLHGPALGNEIIRPVPFADANLFRRLSVLHAYLPVLGISIVLLAVFWDRAVEFLGGLTIPMWIATQVALATALGVLTVLPRCFFHPRRLPIAKQNRAIALSYYTCGVLAWGPVSLAILGVMWLIGMGGGDRVACVTVLVLLAALVVLAWWIALLCLARRALRAGLLRISLIAVGVPLLWALIGGLILVTIPAVVLYVMIVVGTFLTG